ncbi:PASTA domain-containing protein [Nocardioides sp.]|uniref:PASTA domain-containing protein n=1 Tax=Nocardioides sp. TaxID=35761 RepID=UPI001A1E7D54|nr:PASTA domain-containing protein [Nocardioides sp.]MBJ7359780.1 PASTA domain-containing protein [Nocardioides sp.]
MNVDEYVAARYGRLLERAVELGAPEGQAAEYVDLVLQEQRKAIRRADDPDPVVLDALERAVLRIPDHQRGPWPFVAVGLAGIAVAVGVVLTQEPEREPLPSLFGLTGDRARAFLEDDGYEVLLRERRACEPMGTVVDSDPRAGDPVPSGATVSVFTAVPAGSQCEADYRNREDAWEFLSFAISGSSSPDFARTVTVVIDGVEGEPRSGVGAETSPRWEALRAMVAEQSAVPAATLTGQPVLAVTEGVPPVRTCGLGRPPGAADRTALRLEVDARGPDEARGCPLTVDLYRDSEDVIDAVVIYSAVPPD